MTAKTTITITDSANTPTGSPAATDRIFAPSGMEGNTHVFTNGATGETGASLSTLKASISRGNVVSRVKVALALPLVHTVDEVEEVAHVCRANVEFLIPVNADKDERRDLYTLLLDALADSGINTMVVSLEDLY